MVIRGGENIYAAEVEAALYEHPDVIEAAIVGVPDERYGEQVAAVVRRRDGSTLDVPTMQEHVRERLAVRSRYRRSCSSPRPSCLATPRGRC